MKAVELAVFQKVCCPKIATEVCTLRKGGGRMGSGQSDFHRGAAFNVRAADRLATHSATQGR